MKFIKLSFLVIFSFFYLQISSVSAGSVQDSVTVTVTANPSASLTADDTSLDYNTGTTLHINSTGTSYCTLTYPSGGTNTGGSVWNYSTGNLTVDSTYSLSCGVSTGGTLTDSVTINVLVPVNGDCGSTHYSCDAGTSASNVETGSGWTWSCNGSNGGTNATNCSESKGACYPSSTPSNYGNSCTGATSSPNSCGETNLGTSGTIQCNGTCSGSAGTTPPDPATYGDSCTSSSNSCGDTDSGTIQCNGTCSASTPDERNNYGNSCTGATSSPNSCGQTNPGTSRTIQCNGTCSGAAGTTPPDPATYGDSCTSSANVCGQTNSGSIDCSGSCSVGTPSNSLCMYDLTISKTGMGTVTSAPAGISCGADCAQSYSYNTSVMLTATPNTGYSFTGWSGGGCSGTGNCTVSMTVARAVSATFTINKYNLNVTKNGSGTGIVASNPSGINCGADCSEQYDYNTLVTLTASSSLDSSFSGWSGGGCSGTGNCTVTVDSTKTVTATFTKIPVITSLTVSPDPVEFGTSTDISFTSQYAAYCVMLLDFNMSPTLWEGASGSHTANTGNLSVEGSHMASVSCMNADGADSGLVNVPFTVSPDDIAPTILPITAIGADKLYATWNLQFNVEGDDADIGDTIHYVVDWMDGSPNTTTPTVVISSSGLPGYTRMTVSHMWNTSGPKTFRARTVDLKGKTSAWENFSFDAKLLPPLPTIDSLVSNKPLNQIEYNDTVNLAWTSTGADSCSMATNFSPGVNVISNFSDAQSLDNNKDFVPPQKTIYTLTCRNDAGEAKKSITIIVGKMDPTITEF